MESFKFKDDSLTKYKNYRALCEMQSGCQLKLLHIEGERKYMREFNDYIKENSITYEVTAIYLYEQN